MDVHWRERLETINAPEAHRTELSADENSSKKGRSWVSKSCNVARPHDQVQIFRNGLDHPQTEFQNFPWQKAALCCMHCMPVKLFSRSDSPPDSKILFPSTEQTTSLPASLALSENEKPPKQKLFCDCGQHPHDTGLLFANFQGILRSASWSTSQPIFFL